MTTTTLPIITVNLTGYAHVSIHETKTGKKVPRLHFTADEEFVAGDRLLHADHFVRAYWGEMLLDWKGLTAPLTARDYGFRQRVSLTIRLNRDRYWDIVALDILGDCEFEPDSPHSHATVTRYPHRDRLPALVQQQLAENESTPRRSSFHIHKNGPWITPSGRPEDMVPRSRPAVPTANAQQ